MISLKTKFFKLREPKKFAYTPRYYDERKEKLDDLIRKHSNREDKDAEQLRREINFRQNMTNRWQSKNNNARAAKQRMIRLVLLLGALVVAALYAINKLGLWDQFF